MATEQNFIKYVTGHKTTAENLEDDLKNQITVKAQQLKDAAPDNPEIPKWKAEMRNLQERWVGEPEAAVHSLCDEIQEKTGLSKQEILKRSTDATNRKLKGPEWAKFVLGVD